MIGGTDADALLNNLKEAENLISQGQGGRKKRGSKKMKSYKMKKSKKSKKSKK